MKTKLTKKAARESFSCIYAAQGQADGYLESLLGSPQFYFTRSEGWACDGWVFNGDLITAGYAALGTPIGGYEYFKGWYNRCFAQRYDLKKEKQVKRNFARSLDNLITKTKQKEATK